jgi:predicted DNA-binding antitoxin AbrB/MazE fold protein
MTQITEAVYADGVLKPDNHLSLRPNERVRLIIQSLESPDANDRRQAIEELRAGIGRSPFRSDRPYPTRDQLHERR